jgi:hypothetical protein
MALSSFVELMLALAPSRSLREAIFAHQLRTQVAMATDGTPDGAPAPTPAAAAAAAGAAGAAPVEDVAAAVGATGAVNSTTAAAIEGAAPGGTAAAAAPSLAAALQSSHGDVTVQLGGESGDVPE